MNAQQHHVTLSPGAKERGDREGRLCSLWVQVPRCSLTGCHWQVSSSPGPLLPHQQNGTNHVASQVGPQRWNEKARAERCLAHSPGHCRFSTQVCGDGDRDSAGDGGGGSGDREGGGGRSHCQGHTVERLCFCITQGRATRPPARRRGRELPQEAWEQRGEAASRRVPVDLLAAGT